MKRIAIVILLATLTPPAQAADEGPDIAAWAYYVEVTPAKAAVKYHDFVLPLFVFDQARADLADLRLIDAAGQEVPFALRVRHKESKQVEIEAKEFNRGEGPEGSSEVSLELDRGTEHNQVEVAVAGDNFRRRAVISGSNDGDEWLELAEESLLLFESLKNDDLRISYPKSSFRYLRVRVYQDPEVDDEPVEIKGLTVRRTINLAGEYVRRAMELSPREALPVNGAPGSGWIADLGGRNVPVETLRISVAEGELSRDYVIEEIQETQGFYPFRTITAGTWERAKDEQRVLAVSLEGEIQAGRLRILVADHANPPLTIDEVTYTAAARQIVWEAPQGEAPLKLYYGNPDAQPPQYDFDRLLPDVLPEKPQRATLLEPTPNPGYIPPPQAVTERWPWLVYVVLVVVGACLAVVIFSVARTTIRQLDQRQAPA